jgi:hypothetical protein
VTKNSENMVKEWASVWWMPLLNMLEANDQKLKKSYIYEVSLWPFSIHFISLILYLRWSCIFDFKVRSASTYSSLSGLRFALSTAF